MNEDCRIHFSIGRASQMTPSALQDDRLNAKLVLLVGHP